MACRETTHSGTTFAAPESLFDQFPDHPHEGRMSAGASGADEVDPEFVRLLLRFDVKVEEHLEVV